MFCNPTVVVHCNWGQESAVPGKAMISQRQLVLSCLAGHKLATHHWRGKKMLNYASHEIKFPNIIFSPIFAQHGCTLIIKPQRRLSLMLTCFFCIRIHPTHTWGPLVGLPTYCCLLECCPNVFGLFGSVFRKVWSEPDDSPLKHEWRSPSVYETCSRCQKAGIDCCSVDSSRFPSIK